MKLTLEKIEKYNKRILIAMFVLLTVTIIFCLTQKLYLFAFSLTVLWFIFLHLENLEKKLLKKMENEK